MGHKLGLPEAEHTEETCIIVLNLDTVDPDSAKSFRDKLLKTSFFSQNLPLSLKWTLAHSDTLLGAIGWASDWIITMCATSVVSNPVGPARRVTSSHPSLRILPLISFYPGQTAGSMSAPLPLYRTPNMHYGLDIAYNISTALGANTGLGDSTKAGSDISPCPQIQPLLLTAV